MKWTFLFDVFLIEIDEVAGDGIGNIQPGVEILSQKFSGGLSAMKVSRLQQRGPPRVPIQRRFSAVIRFACPMSLVRWESNQ